MDIKPFTNKIKNYQFIPVLFFSLYLIIGLLIFDDYGISWDEDVSRRNGLVSAQYIGEVFAFPFFKKRDGIPDLKSYRDKDYGIFFEILLVTAEYYFDIKDTRSLYLLRHALTFLFLYGCSIAFYFLIYRVFKNWQIALFGSAMLILCPRIFAHSFFNSKDAIFMGFTILNILTMVFFLQEKRLYFAVIHGVCSAATIAVRITGIYLPVMTLAFVFILILIDLKRRNSIEVRKSINSVMIFILFLCICTYIFWPYLWEDPGNFFTAFENMKKFRWDSYVLYGSRFIKATDLPWHYSLIWMGITIPVTYISLFMIGSVCTFVISICKIRTIFTDKRLLLQTFFLILFTSPLLAVIYLKSVLYDGWRHLYFLYPAFVLVSCYGATILYTWFKVVLFIKLSRTMQLGFITLAIATVFLSSIWAIVSYHPHQQTYFNIIAGKNLISRFELDYWGLSYKQALEYILKTDMASLIPIAVANKPGKLNVGFLPKNDRDRIKIVSFNEAKYFLSNFRWEKELSLYLKNEYPYINRIFSIQTSSEIIMGVYELQK